MDDLFRTDYTTFVVCRSYGYGLLLSNGVELRDNPNSDEMEEHCDPVNVRLAYDLYKENKGDGCGFELVYTPLVPYYRIEPGVDSTEIRSIDFRQALIDAKKEGKLIEMAEMIISHGELIQINDL